MQKFSFDKEIISNQLSVLNNTLVDQRQNKITFLSHLEKLSNAIYENFNSESIDSLLSLINEARSIFECTKSNINKILELKNFLENISKSDHLYSIDSEKFNKDFNTLLENISKNNSNYLTFMNNYEIIINPPQSINTQPDFIENYSEENIEMESDKEALNTDQESEKLEDTNISIENDYLDENITQQPNEETDEICEEHTINNEISAEENQIPKINEESIIEKELLNLPENQLIIDKKTGVAILPFTIPILKEIYLNDIENYTSIQDIIDKTYTIKLKDLENSSIARYREAFKLAKEKSNYTFSQAANFAKELLVETKITSLIIASCRNVEELEFYIECLNNNNLDNFHYFKIIEKD